MQRNRGFVSSRVSNWTGFRPISRPRSPISANGGTVFTLSGFVYHLFTATANFEIVSPNATVEALIIAGGGGGGFQVGGGGGAGGLVGQTFSLVSGVYPVTVGAAGAGAPNETTQGSNGGNSSFNGVTSIGGGRAANYNAPHSTAGSGGSGGGGTGNSANTTTPGGAGTAGQGFAGGTGFVTQWAGGGGGGASQQGFSSPSAGVGGRGGDGSSAYSIWGIATNTGQNISEVRWYAGGGGGCMTGGSGSSNFSAGGNGGGGRGFGNNARDIVAGTFTGDDGLSNTGGGGGGVRDWYTGTSLYTRAGNGGSGVVIIRYEV